jgi:serine/threonine protein kinase
MDLKPGSFVAAKYRVVRILGRGAMGTVWEAVHTLTDRRVALKILAEDHQTAEARARILREARACGRIQHRNVIEVFDISELEDGRPFLVMPILHGETLEDRLERAGPCPEADAIEIGVGVARALVAAHALGIVHRDLKPSNIFLHTEPGSREVTVKVLDFGISKILSRDEASYTDAGRAVGSPAYMSPEQAKGAADIDGRSDVWSFGICLFELLTAGLPFPGETPYAMVGHILHGPPPDFDALCPEVSPELRALIRRCVVRDPSKRLGSAAELLLALEAARGERPPSSLTATGPRSLRAGAPGPPPSGPGEALAPLPPVDSQGQAAPAAGITGPAPGPHDDRAGEPGLPAPITATASVLITQKLPARRRGAWGLFAGATLTLGAAAAVAFIVLSGAGSAPSSSNDSSAPGATAPAPAQSLGGSSRAAASTTSLPAQPSGTSPPAPTEAAATTEAAPAEASSAAPPAAASSTQKGSVPAKRPPPRAPPAKTGRVALPDSPG